MSLKQYICELKRHKRFNNVAYVIVPYEICSEQDIRSQITVKGTIDGIPFRKTMASLGKNEYVLVINLNMLKSLNKNEGDFVEVIIEKNIIKEISLEDTFLKTLKAFPIAFQRFNNMPKNYRNEYINFLNESDNSNGKHSESAQLFKIKNIIEMFNN